MTEQNILDLQKIVGNEDCYSDKTHLTAYCYDATKDRKYPECVVFPHNEEEVSKVLKYCNTHKIKNVEFFTSLHYDKHYLHHLNHQAYLKVL